MEMTLKLEESELKLMVQLWLQSKGYRANIEDIELGYNYLPDLKHEVYAEINIPDVDSSIQPLPQE